MYRPLIHLRHFFQLYIPFLHPCPISSHIHWDLKGMDWFTKVLIHCFLKKLFSIDVDTTEPYYKGRLHTVVLFLWFMANSATQYFITDKIVSFKALIPTLDVAIIFPFWKFHISLISFSSWFTSFSSFSTYAIDISFILPESWPVLLLIINSLSKNTKKINLPLVSIPCSRSTMPENYPSSTLAHKWYLKVNSDRSIPAVRCYCLWRLYLEPRVSHSSAPIPLQFPFLFALVFTSVQQLMITITITRRFLLIRSRPSGARLCVYSYFEKRFRKKCTRQSRKI